MTAYSKAAKREAKRGRKRLVAKLTDREPNGRKTRRRSTGWMEISEKDAMETVIQTRIRHQGITAEQALNPQRGYVLGRLLIEGQITKAEHDIGLRYGEDAARYYGLNGYMQPSTRAQNLFAVRGVAGENDTMADSARAATARFRRIQKALMAANKVSGLRVDNTVRHVCLLDEPVSPGAVRVLQYGLKRLAHDVYGAA